MAELAGHTGVILTSYSRPNCVVDAIQSVLEQDTDKWHLVILDDGSDQKTLDAIRKTVAGAKHDLTVYSMDSPDLDRLDQQARVILMTGKNRSVEERLNTQPYCRTINRGLTVMRGLWEYVCYLCDDDYLYPESVRMRAEYLDRTPEAAVVYGRLRCLYYSRRMNEFREPIVAKPKVGRCSPRPDGRVEWAQDMRSSKWYFAGNELDPDTGAPWVDAAFWRRFPTLYTDKTAMDHNQVMHRMNILDDMPSWEKNDPFRVEFWPERKLDKWTVGDAEFFKRLAVKNLAFHPVDAWVASKRYHVHTYGTYAIEQRRE